MSATMMYECWALDGMSVTQKAVLIALADMATARGECWPTVAALAKRICGSERAVQNAIKALEKAGAIMTQRRAGRVTAYTLTPSLYRPMAAEAEA